MDASQKDRLEQELRFLKESFDAEVISNEEFEKGKERVEKKLSFLKAEKPIEAAVEEKKQDERKEESPVKESRQEEPKPQPPEKDAEESEIKIIEEPEKKN